MEEVGGKLEQALFEIRRVIAGQEEMLERVLVSLLAGGHVLIEGVPGLAKTLTIKTTAAVLGGSFQRVQFTPDLVPSDLVGTRVYRPDRAEFDTELGPVFCNFLLADEINRAPAKVQSALLEVMQEQQVTIGHSTFPVPSPFLVLATQNPIESEGTYPLPEAQVDRFMLKVLVDYPGARRGADGRRALARSAARARAGALARRAAGAAAAGGGGLRRSGADQLDGRRRDRDARARRSTASTTSPTTSRSAPARAARSASSPPARALALIRGRDYVVPADLEALVRDAFRHRLVLSYRALAEEVAPDAILDQVLAAVPMPQIDLGRTGATASA